LQPIIQEEMGQIEAVRNDTSMSMDQKVAKVRQIKQTEFPKIQAVLTPEQQKKLADIQERAKQQGAGQAGSSNPGGAQGNSQPPR
jgi:Spy/CpxP family protein refolding chaperone